MTVTTAGYQIEPYDLAAWERWDQILTEPEFVIVGTGRSGTGYISQIFTRVGIRCGHEQWWNPPGNRTPGLIGDASWLAVPHLDDYPGKVGLQLRDPLKVMRSLLNGQLFDLARTSLYYRYKAQYVEFTGDPVIDAAKFIVEWTANAAIRADRMWRLEDLDVDEVVDLTVWAGHPADRDIVAEAVGSTSTNWNRHPNHAELEWVDLPDHPVIDQLRVVAETGGYL